MTNLILEYTALCSNCNRINYPMIAPVFLEDNDEKEFDPYKIDDFWESGCMHCHNSDKVQIGIVKMDEKIFSIRDLPFQGIIIIEGDKKNIEEKVYIGGSEDYTFYDLLNAHSEVIQYLSDLKEYSNNEPISIRNLNKEDIFIDETYIGEDNFFKFTVLFSGENPYLEIVSPTLQGITISEVIEKLLNQKQIILEELKDENLPTFQ